MKNNMRYLLILTAAAAVMGFFPNKVAAQGNFDPAAFRERQLKDAREAIDVKSDEDWDKKIEPLVAKVLDAQRDVGRTGGFGLGFGRGGGRGRGTGNDQGNANRNRQSNPEREALQKAIEDKAPGDEVKAKLAKYRESRKTKEAALEKSQEDLQKALSPRQEAGAVLAGLLK